MLFTLMATLCAGLFAGAAIYISLVEHPARMECGTELAATEFGPSYRRATLLQASLAALGFSAAVTAWVQGAHGLVLVGGALLGSDPIYVAGDSPDEQASAQPAARPAFIRGAWVVAAMGAAPCCSECSERSSVRAAAVAA